MTAAAYVSSKIFNSEVSLLEFLRKDLVENDKLVTGIKKRIFELLIAFVEANPEQVVPYLAKIKDTCMRSFLSDKNALVRDEALKLVIKIVRDFKPEDAEAILKPAELMQRLCGSIKHGSRVASVKGTVWHCVGALHAKYGEACR